MNNAAAKNLKFFCSPQSQVHPDASHVCELFRFAFAFLAMCPLKKTQKE